MSPLNSSVKSWRTEHRVLVRSSGALTAVPVREEGNRLKEVPLYVSYWVRPSCSLLPVSDLVQLSALFGLFKSKGYGLVSEIMALIEKILLFLNLKIRRHYKQQMTVLEFCHFWTKSCSLSRSMRTRVFHFVWEEKKIISFKIKSVEMHVAGIQSSSELEFN